MSSLLRRSRKKDKKDKKSKEERRNEKKDKRDFSPAKSGEQRSIVRALSSNKGGSMNQSLLGGGGGYGADAYDGGPTAEADSLLRRPLNFRSPSGKSRARTSYGSSQAEVSGQTSLGITVSKFTSTIRHPVELDDTWARISLKYRVTSEDIRRVNNMMIQDQLLSKAELLIPVNDSNKDFTKDMPKGPQEGDTKEPNPDDPDDPDDDEVAAAGPVLGAPFYANSVEPSSKAKDFLAKFDMNFGKTKQAVADTDASLTNVPVSSGMASPVWSKTQPPKHDPRIGSGIKGDTTGHSYQRAG